MVTKINVLFLASDVTIQIAAGYSDSGALILFK